MKMECNGHKLIYTLKSRMTVTNSISTKLMLTQQLY
jgi:hypothetical protein